MTSPEGENLNGLILMFWCSYVGMYDLFILLQVIWAQHYQCGLKVVTVKRKAYNTLHHHSLVPFNKHNVTSTALKIKAKFFICLMM